MSFSSAENFRIMRTAIEQRCRSANVDPAVWAAAFEHGYSHGMCSKVSVDGTNTNLMYFVSDFLDKLSSDICDFSKINMFDHYHKLILDANNDRSLFVRGCLQLASNVPGNDSSTLQRNLASVLETNNTELYPLMVNTLLMDSKGVRVSSKSKGININEDFYTVDDKRNLDNLYAMANNSLTGGIDAGEVELFLFCVYWTILTQIGPVDAYSKNKLDSGYLIDRVVLGECIKALLTNAFAKQTMTRVTNKFTPINKQPKDDLSSFHTFYVLNSHSQFTSLVNTALSITDKSVMTLDVSQINSHVSPIYADKTVYGTSSIVKLILETLVGKNSMSFSEAPEPPMQPKGRFSADENINVANMMFSLRLMSLIHSSFNDVVKALNFHS